MSKTRIKSRASALIGDHLYASFFGADNGVGLHKIGMGGDPSKEIFLDAAALTNLLNFLNSLTGPDQKILGFIKK